MLKFIDYLKETTEQVTGQVTEQVTEQMYPSGVYISLKLSKESVKKFQLYLKENLPHLTATKEPHLTLIYSKNAHKGAVQVKKYKVCASVKGFDIFGDEKSLVAILDSNEINKRNAELVRSYGFVSDFDVYKAHITLSHGAEKVDLKGLPSLGELCFDTETVEPLDTDWLKKSKN